MRETQTHKEITAELGKVRQQSVPLVTTVLPNLEQVLFRDLANALRSQFPFFLEGLKVHSQVYDDREDVSHQPEAEPHLPESGIRQGSRVSSSMSWVDKAI